MQNNIKISESEAKICLKLIEVLKKEDLLKIVINKRIDYKYSEKAKICLTKNEDNTWSNYIILKGQIYESKTFSSIIPAAMNIIRLFSNTDEEYVSNIRTFLTSEDLMKEEKKIYQRKKD